MDGAGKADSLRPAAATLSADELYAARYGFHRAFPRQSAKRVFHLTQLIVIATIATGLWWAFDTAPALTWRVLHVSAIVLFAAAILWRLIAAAQLTPLLTRLAEPAHWPTYTILCPLYREANVAPDLVAALKRIDYPGTE